MFCLCVVFFFFVLNSARVFNLQAGVPSVSWKCKCPDMTTVSQNSRVYFWGDEELSKFHGAFTS